MLKNRRLPRVIPGSPRKNLPSTRSLLVISLGLVILAVVSPYFVHADTGSVTVDGIPYDVSYDAVGVGILGFDTDPEWPALIVSMDAASSGILDVTLGSDLLDSLYDEAGGEFEVLADDDLAVFSETETMPSSRALTIVVPAGTQEILIGTIPAEDPAPVDAAEDPAPVDAAEDPAPVDAAEDPAPVDAAEDPAPVDAAEDPAPVDAAEDPAPVDAAEDPAPVDAAEDPAPVDAAEDPMPIGAAVDASSSTSVTASDGATSDMASTDPTGDTADDPGMGTADDAVNAGTVTADGQTVECGPGTVLEDGVCILDEPADPPEPLETAQSESATGQAESAPGKPLLSGLSYGIVMAFIIAGGVGALLGAAARSSMRNRQKN